MFLLLFSIGVVLLKFGYGLVLLNHYQNNQSGLELLGNASFPNLNEVFNNISSFPNSGDVFKISFDNENSTYDMNLSKISITQTIIIKANSIVDLNLNETQFFIAGDNGILKLINLNLGITKNPDPTIGNIFNVSNGGQMILFVIYFI